MKASRRRKRRRWLAGFGLVAAVAGAGLIYRQAHRTRTVPVFVNDRPLAVRSHRPSVEDALEQAHRRPAAGRLLAVVSHRVLKAVADPGRVLVDGAVAKGSRRLRDGDRITVIDGVDAVEGVAYVGLPDVERMLWRPGVKEVDTVTAGDASGEVVTRQQVTAPVGARPEPEKVVAITFDDGPNPQWTPAVLDMLNAKGVRATFCVVGYATQRFPNLVKLEAADNEVVCDHTLDHIIPLSKRPISQIADQIWKQADLIQSVTGKDPILFRSPGGDVAPTIVTEAHLRRLRVMQWSVDPHDYQRPGAAVIAARVLSQVRPGAIILLHDGGGDRSETLAALRAIIDGLHAQGYVFTTVLDEPPT